MYVSVKRQETRIFARSKGQIVKCLRDRNIDLDAVDARILSVPGAWVRGLVKPSVGFVDSGIA
jgi:hypothetical protein